MVLAMGVKFLTPRRIEDYSRPILKKHTHIHSVYRAYGSTTSTFVPTPWKQPLVTLPSIRGVEQGAWMKNSHVNIPVTL